jgi:hypothetical protein
LGRDASESDDDGAIPRDPAYFGGSLLTGHRGEMPIAAPRALPRPTSNASGSPPSSASSNATSLAPSSTSPVHDVTPPASAPAAHPTIQHLRGRITLRR